MKVFILSLFVFVSAGLAQFASNPNTIILNAVKDSAVTADEMVVDITVNKTDTSSSKVNELSHNSLIDVLKVLDRYGYKKKDIFLISSNLQKQYPKPNEYFSVQSYKIILNKFDLFDQLKKDLVQAGATGVTISTFWASDYEKIKKNLYDEAIAEANEKAKYFCSQIGAKNFRIENLMDNSREESINGNLTFMNNNAGVLGLELTAVIPGSNIVEPTITNGRINISVSLRITFNYNY